MTDIEKLMNLNNKKKEPKENTVSSETKTKKRKIPIVPAENINTLENNQNAIDEPKIEDVIINSSFDLPYGTQYIIRIPADIKEQKYKISMMNRNGATKEKLKQEMIILSSIMGMGRTPSVYEGLYMVEDPKVREKFIDKRNNLYLDKFDPEGWKRIENSKAYQDAVNTVVKKAEKQFWENRTHGLEKIGVVFAERHNINLMSKIEYALGKSVILARPNYSITKNKEEKYELRIYIKYNLSDRFEKPVGDNIPIEWGIPYDMVGPSREKVIYTKTFNNEREAKNHLNQLTKLNKGTYR